MSIPLARARASRSSATSAWLLAFGLPPNAFGSMASASPGISSAATATAWAMFSGFLEASFRTAWISGWFRALVMPESVASSSGEKFLLISLMKATVLGSKALTIDVMPSRANWKPGARLLSAESSLNWVGSVRRATPNRSVRRASEFLSPASLPSPLGSLTATMLPTASRILGSTACDAVTRTESARGSMLLSPATDCGFTRPKSSTTVATSCGLTLPLARFPTVAGSSRRNRLASAPTVLGLSWRFRRTSGLTPSCLATCSWVRPLALANAAGSWAILVMRSSAAWACVEFTADVEALAARGAVGVGPPVAPPAVLVPARATAVVVGPSAPTSAVSTSCEQPAATTDTATSAATRVTMGRRRTRRVLSVPGRTSVCPGARRRRRRI